MYGSKARSYSYSSGEEQQQKTKIIETHKEEEVGLTPEIAKSCDSSSNGESINEDFDIEIDDNLQWELPPSSVMSPPSPPPDHSMEQEEIQEISTTVAEPSKDAMVEETMESTVTRLQEELEALTSLVSMNESPKSSPPLVGGGTVFDKSAGIGQIMSSTVKSVTIEPEQLMYSENIRYDNDNEEIFASTSDTNEEDLTVSDIGVNERRSDFNRSGVNEEGERNSYTNQQKERVPFQDSSIETTAPINEDDMNVKLYQKERWKTYRQEAEGKEEKPTSTPSLDRTPVPIPNDPPPTHHDDIDPFAPIAMKTSTSSHLLSDVLSLNKTDLTSNPKAFKSQTANSYSYKTTSSYTPNKAAPTQSFSNNSRPYTQTNSKPSLSTSSQSQVRGGYDKDTRQPSFEAQDEIQEMHGVKVRAVQRKRWTPDTTRSQRSESLTKMPSVNTSYHSPMTQQSSVDQQSTLNKKSSIYERRDVVLMEVRNRGWSQGQDSSYKHVCICTVIHIRMYMYMRTNI